MDERLIKIIGRVLALPEHEIRPELTAAQVERWDSLGHLELILEIEKEFGLQFRADDIPRLKSVGELLQSLKTQVQPPLDGRKPVRQPR